MSARFDNPVLGIKGLDVLHAYVWMLRRLGAPGRRRTAFQHTCTGAIDCAMCREVAEKNAAEFTADKTRNLIVRLQFNVIRAGLRRVNLAYSRISLADVAAKLGAVYGHTSLSLARTGGTRSLCLSISASLLPCLFCHMNVSVQGLAASVSPGTVSNRHALLCRSEQRAGH